MCLAHNITEYLMIHINSSLYLVNLYSAIARHNISLCKTYYISCAYLFAIKDKMSMPLLCNPNKSSIEILWRLTVYFYHVHFYSAWGKLVRMFFLHWRKKDDWLINVSLLVLTDHPLPSSRKFQRDSDSVVSTRNYGTDLAEEDIRLYPLIITSKLLGKPQEKADKT